MVLAAGRDLEVLAGEAAGFGLLGGGLEAALAEPGDRLKAFGRGLGTGTVTGLGWGVGSRAMGNVMGSALGKGRFETLKNAPLWGKNEAGQLAARTPAGKIDWTAIDSLAGTLKADGWCVLENTIANLIQEAIGAGTGSGTKLASGRATAADLTAGISQLRTKHFPGKTFKLKPSP